MYQGKAVGGSGYGIGPVNEKRSNVRRATETKSRLSTRHCRYRSVKALRCREWSHCRASEVRDRGLSGGDAQLCSTSVHVAGHHWLSVCQGPGA